VIIGDHKAFFVDNEARTKTGLFELSLGIFTEKFLKKILKWIVVAMRVAPEIPKNGSPALDDLNGTDVDYGRTGHIGQLAEASRYRDDIRRFGISRRIQMQSSDNKKASQ
jgi:hypothetical protein